MRDGTPRFVSPSTKGITVAITGATALTQTFALTPTATGCSGTSAVTTCAFSIAGLKPCSSATNCYTAAVSTYDAVVCATTCTIPAGAHELSAAQSVGFGVTAGTANTVNLTLGGIPKFITVSPFRQGFLQGSASALTLYGAQAQVLSIEPRDADGNVIVGPGAPAITASTTATKLAVANPASATPNRLTLRAVTFGSPPAVLPGTVALKISVVPFAQSGGATIVKTIPVTIAHSVLYVGLGSSIDEFFDGNTGTPNETISGSNPDFDVVAGVAVDKNDTLYAASEENSTFLGFASGTFGNAVPNIDIFGGTTGLNAPFGAAISENGLAYVTNAGTASVVAYAPGSNGNATPSVTIAGPATGMNVPLGLASDSYGTLYVANFSTPSVTEYAVGANGDAAPSASIQGLNTRLSDPEGVALDVNANLYVADYGQNDVTEYASGASGNVAPIALIQGVATQLVEPIGVAVDANGTIYVANGNPEVLIFPAGSNGNATSVSFTVPSDPQSIAVVPAAIAP
jgi:hypothetical protein